LATRSSKALSVSFDFASAGAEGRPQAEWNQVVVEILPHPLSILEQLWPAEPESPMDWKVHNPSAGELLAQGAYAGLPVSLRISMSARPTHCHMTIHHAAGALRLDLFHGFVSFDSAKVSRSAKLLAPLVRSAKTFGKASINLIQRAFKRQPAYPGLGTLLAQSYAAMESGDELPIKSTQIRAVAQNAALIAGRMEP
jgi:hypothetical protein